MAPWNMTFAVFVLDPRPFEEWLPGLNEMFGGRFVQDMEYKGEGRLRYVNYVFGLTINCFEEETWPEGRVYYLTGANDSCCQFDTPEQMDMNFHVRKLLEPLALAQIMTFEEFREQSQYRRRAKGP